MNEFSPTSTGFREPRLQLDIQIAAPVKLAATRQRNPTTSPPRTSRAKRRWRAFARPRRRFRRRSDGNGSGAGLRPRPRLDGLIGPPWAYEQGKGGERRSSVDPLRPQLRVCAQAEVAL